MNAPTWWQVATRPAMPSGWTADRTPDMLAGSWVVAAESAPETAVGFPCRNRHVVEAEIAMYDLTRKWEGRHIVVPFPRLPDPDPTPDLFGDSGAV